MAEKPATAEPKRRWYQFSLRALLISVVVLSIPLGYVAHEAVIVRDRKAFLVKEAAGYEFDSLGAYLNAYPRTDPEKLPSMVRRWLGDEPVLNVDIDDTAPISVRKRAAALFPEAQISDVQVFHWTPEDGDKK